MTIDTLRVAHENGYLHGMSIGVVLGMMLGCMVGLVLGAILHSGAKEPPPPAPTIRLVRGSE